MDKVGGYINKGGISVKFKELFPDYQAYSNEHFLMNEVTHSLLKAISYKLPSLLREKTSNRNGFGKLDLDGSLKNMCNIVSEYTNNDKTTHWGWNYIIRDFEEQMLDFQHVRFCKFMDAIQRFAELLGNAVDELNDIFEEHNFGYRLTNEPEIAWICVNPNIGMAIQIGEVIETTSEVCKQTAEHIKQAKEHLKRGNESRARKDAIRDCLSAMEALMKKLTNTGDVKDAYKIMSENKEYWGPRVIIVDGITLWNLFHDKYPDTRHGNPEISEISYEQAIYFIDRILAYVKYLSTRAIEEDEFSF